MTDGIFSQVQSALQKISKEKTPLLVAIDGRCGAGKSTLADQLQKRICCNVFHMDDFFLPPKLRTKERLEQPGGNVDYKRFYSEVLLPVMKGVSFSYRPYGCHLQQKIEPVYVQSKLLNLVEGSYSCHPCLWNCYNLRIFLDIDHREQLRRFRKRNGVEQLKIFVERWIPLEERYFSAFQVQKRCDLCF